MLRSRAPWWMYAVAALYVLTICFNARQEFLGPAGSGWIPAWPELESAGVVPGSPMDKAGLQKGDVFEFVDGRPLTGMPDWFVDRAHFKRDRPVDIQVRRGGQLLRLQFVITLPGWRALRTWHIVTAPINYLARFVLMLLAIFIAFGRPDVLSARLAALMLATTAVAEGYPSAGWAAALHDLPVIVAIPICLATASWLLGSLPWLAFFAVFPRPFITRPWQRMLLLVPLIIFVPTILTSAIALIYARAPVPPPAGVARFLQDIAGVVPLIFLNVWQPYLLDLWFSITVLFLAAGFVLLAINARREPRVARPLLLSVLAIGLATVHNFFSRNWSNWIGSAPPAFFSSAMFTAEAILFIVACLWSVAAWRRHDINREASRR